MPPTFAERLRRALRDDLRDPPYRLLDYSRGYGPTVERDGLRMAVTVQGRWQASVIGYLTWKDPVSEPLWRRIPREALHERWMDRIGGQVQFVPPVWYGSLQTAGGTGTLISTVPVSEPGTGKVRHDEEAEEEHERRIRSVVTETRRQLDLVRRPSIEEIDLELRYSVKAANTHPRALALYYAVRGRPDDAQSVIALAVEHESAQVATAKRGVWHADEVERLGRFALWLRDAPVLATEGPG